MIDTPIYSDAFTYADGALTGRGTPAWLALPSFYLTTIVSSGTIIHSASEDNAKGNLRPSNAATDQYVEADVRFSRITLEDYLLLTCRVADPSVDECDQVFAQVFNTGRCTIRKQVSGVFTWIAEIDSGAPGAPSWTADTFKRVRFQALGPVYRLYVDGVLILTATDAATSVAGTVGLRLRTAGNGSANVIVDNFEWGVSHEPATSVYLHASHRFGTFECESPADGRRVRSFDYEFPKETEAYRAHLASRKRKETFNGPIYNDTTHHLGLDFSDASAVAGDVNNALNTIIPGATWTFADAGATTALSALVLDVEASEVYFSYQEDGRTWACIDFVIRTTPGWSAPETVTPLSASSVILPGVITALAVLGSMPASFRAFLTFDQATTMQALGFRHALATGVTQDYQGTADTDALSGQSAQGTMDADGFALGTPATLDSNTLRGWWLPIVRVEQPDATPGDTTYFATSTVTGSGLAGTQGYVTESVPATVQNLFQKRVLPPLPIPAGAIPDITTGSGWGGEAVQAQNAVDEGTVALQSELASGYKDLMVKQTFPSFTGRVTAIQYTIGSGLNAYPDTSHHLWVGQEDVGVFETVNLVATDLAAGVHKITLPTPLVCVSGVTWSFRINLADSGNDLTFALAHSNADYADGALTTVMGSGEAAGDDLTFAVYGQTMLGFNSTVAISAANAGAGTGKLDTVCLIPYDEFSVVAEVAGAATEGMLIDAMGDDTVIYETKIDGSIGPIDQAITDPQGTARLWPGSTAIVIDADTANAVPQGCALTLYYKPTYKTPYGG